MRLHPGIRLQLGIAALAILALPWLAAQAIVRMESILRSQQEAAIQANARAIMAALSDRPKLFEHAAGVPDDPQTEERRRIVALFAAADPDAAASLGTAYRPSDEIERLLQIMGKPGSRMWVVDVRSRVRGLSGTLREPRAAPNGAARGAFAGWLRPVAELVVPTPRVPIGDETKPVRSQIDKALIGVTSTSWRGTRDRDVAILSTAQPIFVGDDIVGAVIVEETTGSIQILKQSALERLLGVTIVVTVTAFALLLFFASRLAARVRRLHREAEAAIDPQGRIAGTIAPSTATDEIGDLSRTMAALLARLHGYNAYLEAMAGRLSHELRTPVAVVRSSLDNLKAQKLSDDARVYVERAGEGVDRLARLISRLSEATRLERMLESAERERFDLNALVASCVEGYRLAYPRRRFAFEPAKAALTIHGVPDAFAQLLDKLVENADDFAPEGSEIRIALEAQGRLATLAVENEGSRLPEGMAARLFDSMVSMRAQRDAAADDRRVHLGLGLHVVRLVAEFHGGRARARDRSTCKGVRFEVSVPVAPQNP